MNEATGPTMRPLRTNQTAFAVKELLRAAAAQEVQGHVVLEMRS